MLSSWSNENKITTKGLQVQTLVAMTSARTNSLVVYDCHRIATKSYHYFGMSEAAARACQAAKIAQYTRRIYHFYNSSGSSEITFEDVCVANVSLDYDDADMWTVSIDVSEDQQQYFPYAVPFDPYAMGLFDTSFDYDEDDADGSYIRITSCYRENAALYLAYEQSISDFDSASMVVQSSTDGGTTWADATPSAKTDSLVTFLSGAWTNGLYRLKWSDTVVSNAQATPDADVTRTLVLADPSFNTVYGKWYLDYTQDFSGFDRTAVIVYTKTVGATTWTDITSSCVLRTGQIYTSITDKDTQRYFKIAYDGVASNEVLTPYSPSSDVGDGSMVLLGAYNDLPSSTYFNVILKHEISSFDSSLITAKVSEDGITWSDLAVTESYSGDLWYGTIDTSTSDIRYVKFYYDGTQATCGFAIPYTDGTDSLWHLGLAPDVSSTTAWFNQSIASFDASLLELQVSTDSGSTWETVSGTAGYSNSRGTFSFDTALGTDYDARLFRFVYDGTTYTNTIKYPLA